MPRRCAEVVQLPLPVKKKPKVLDEASPSLDTSFFDDEALPPGIVFSDIQQKKWRIGKPIGRGSFGRIYLASDEVDKDVTKATARYVVKIEPHTNGPLFVEVHCLIRTAQVGKVKVWRQRNKQKFLGMPVYIASGSFTDENTSVKYRFLVLPRYDIDLQKIIARTKVLDLKNVLVLGMQILDVLEYLHNQGYTHSDIKSSNLMLGFNGKKLQKVNIKPTPSYQKDTKEVAILLGKQRKPKTGKSRTSNYYEDEDFIVKDYKYNNSDEDIESDRSLANVKSKLRKILSDKDSRTLHRHHAFNLRQLSSYVNYEDLNSSVCSDQSYQKLLDDFNKPLLSAEEFFEEKQNANGELDEIHKEAVLSQSNGQIYLLDYGLASKFVDSEGKHKDFAMDARKAHDGTLEYSSRDSHIGAHSRRSDLETLGYNLLDWLTGSLPWKTTEVLAEPDLVHALKKNYMSDVKSFLKTCFKTEFYPQFIEKYLQYVTSLEFTDKPDYDYCRSLFASELLKNGYKKDTCLNFDEAPISPMSKKMYYAKRFGRKNMASDFIARNGIKKAYERENVCSLENDLKLELLKQTLNSSSDGIRKPCTSRNFFVSDAELISRLKKSLMPHDVLGKKLSPKNLRSTKRTLAKRRGRKRHRNSLGKFGNFMGSARQFSWAEILAGNPEDIIRKERNMVTQNTDGEETDDDDSNCKYRIRKLSNASSESDSLQSPLRQKDYLQNSNPTYAMKEVMIAFKRKTSGKPAEEPIEGLEGYTPAMIKVYRIKEKREAKEKLEALKQAMTKIEPVVVVPRLTRSTKTKKSCTKNKAITRKYSTEDDVTDTEDEIPNEKITKKSKQRTEEKTNRIQKITKTTQQRTSSESSKESTEKKPKINRTKKATERKKSVTEEEGKSNKTKRSKISINKKEGKIKEPTTETGPPKIKKSSQKTKASVGNKRRLRSSRSLRVIK